MSRAEFNITHRSTPLEHVDQYTHIKKCAVSRQHLNQLTHITYLNTPKTQHLHGLDYARKIIKLTGWLRVEASNANYVNNINTKLVRWFAGSLIPGFLLTS